MKWVRISISNIIELKIWFHVLKDPKIEIEKLKWDGSHLKLMWLQYRSTLSKHPIIVRSNRTGGDGSSSPNPKFVARVAAGTGQWCPSSLLVRITNIPTVITVNSSYEPAVMTCTVQNPPPLRSPTTFLLQLGGHTPLLHCYRPILPKLLWKLPIFYVWTTPTCSKIVKYQFIWFLPFSLDQSCILWWIDHGENFSLF